MAAPAFGVTPTGGAGSGVNTPGANQWTARVNTGAITIKLPDSITDDSLAFFLAYTRTATNATLPDLSGWTAISAAAVATEASVRVFYKAVGSADSGATFTYDFDDNADATVTVRCGIVFTVTGADIAGTPVEAWATNNGVGNPITSPSLVTTGADRLGIRIFCVSDDALSGTPLVNDAADDDWTLGFRGDTLFGSDAAFCIEYKALASAGTASATTQNGGDAGDYWNVVNFAVLPASGASAVAAIAGRHYSRMRA